MKAIDLAETAADLAESAQILRQMGAARVGVTGFCMGGLLTYRAAVTSTVFDAAVGFYGAGIAHELGEPTCPTLLLFGDSDVYIPVADIDTVRAHHADTVVYPGAGHGFFRDGADDYDEAAAADAWARLLRHFGSHLR